MRTITAKTTKANARKAATYIKNRSLLFRIVVDGIVYYPPMRQGDDAAKDFLAKAIGTADCTMVVGDSAL